MSFPEEVLWDKLNHEWPRLSFRQRAFWEAVKILPHEWELPPYGRFWTVGLMGSRLIYYNHMEESFETSSWSRYGTINEFRSWCGTLDEAVQSLMFASEHGYSADPREQGPFAGEYLGRS